jgi:hypothetical protein
MPGDANPPAWSTGPKAPENLSVALASEDQSVGGYNPEHASIRNGLMEKELWI